MTALHPGRCGPCDDCRAALADYAGRPFAARPGGWGVSYGIPPSLDQTFQRTGRGSMFEKPHRLTTGEDAVAVHYPVHHASGVTLPTMAVSSKKRSRHEALYGREGLVDRGRTRANVQRLSAQGKLSGEIADELGVAVKTVERYLRAA